MSGTKMIFPLPQVEVISAETYADALKRADEDISYLDMVAVAPSG
jgi:hypothetical protein